MAPGVAAVTQQARFVDLDVPLLLASDRDCGFATTTPYLSAEPNYLGNDVERRAPTHQDRDLNSAIAAMTNRPRRTRGVDRAGQ